MAETAGNATCPSHNTFSGPVNLCISLLGIQPPKESGSQAHAERDEDDKRDDNAYNKTPNTREKDRETQGLLKNSTHHQRLLGVFSGKPILSMLGKQIWPLLSLGVLILAFCDLFAYMDCKWGHPDDVISLVIHVLSTIAQMMSVSFLCVWIWLGLRIDPSSMPAVIFSNEYLTRIIGVSQGSKTEKLQFLLILSWPIINLLHTLYVYISVESGDPVFGVFKFIIRCALIFSYIQHGCMAFLCFKLRKAFGVRFTEIAKELKVKSENEAKTRICEIYFDYKEFRDFVSYWITFTVSDAVIGMAALVLWNYGYYENGFEHSAFDHPMLVCATMIWNQQLMFISLPLFVFGGVNVDYLWDDFTDEIVYHLMGTESVGQTLSNLFRHMKSLNRPPEWLVPTLIFSLLGFYFGISPKNQDIMYWKGPDCYHQINLTESESTFIPVI